MSPYCTQYGRSKPHFLRIWTMFSWVGRRPAIRSAGSPPGITLKIRKTRTDTAKSTPSMPAMRLITKRVNRGSS